MKYLGVFIAAVMMCYSTTSYAGEYPDKDKVIRIVVSYPPGAANDFLARLMADAMAKRLEVPVIVENHSGANGMIGAELVANAAPDGYTLWLGTDGPMAINKSLYSSMPYDPQDAFQPLSLLARYQLVLATQPSLGLNSLSDFIAHAESDPDTIMYGSPGIGSQHHLAMELLAAMARINMVHVPYAGSAAALTAMLGGEIDAQFVGTAPLRAHIEANAVSPLAVSGAQRSSVLPDLPTISEAGLEGYDIAVWFGLLAPKGTPGNVVEILNREIVKILEDPEIQEKMLVQGLEAESSTPNEFVELIESEIDKWREIVEAAQLTKLD